MVTELADQYYLKALDHYPFDFGAALENLNYALGHDPNHAPAHCLLGRIYMYYVKDYAKAGDCFYNALKGNLNFTETYKHYSLLRIWESEYDRAMHIIEKGFLINGMDRISLMLNKAIVYELKGELRKSKQVLKNAKLLAITKIQSDQVDKELSRIKKKIKFRKKSQKLMRKQKARI